jgi:hypothetical protein
MMHFTNFFRVASIIAIPFVGKMPAVSGGGRFQSKLSKDPSDSLKNTLYSGTPLLLDILQLYHPLSSILPQAEAGAKIVRHSHTDSRTSTTGGNHH